MTAGHRIAPPFSHSEILATANLFTNLDSLKKKRKKDQFFLPFFRFPTSNPFGYLEFRPVGLFSIFHLPDSAAVQ
jgi:hypothetical protein